MTVAPSPNAPEQRLQGLDVLRLMAVLGVVAFHYGFRGPNGYQGAHVAVPELASWARYGFLGVPVFFIISGYVIAYSAEGRSAAAFAIARFSRIYPTFLLCMTLTFVAVVAFGAPHFRTSLATWVANLFIAAPELGHDYIDSAYWSLVIEVIFYGWATLFIRLGLFPRRNDLIVGVWLVLSLLNEMTIDAQFFCKIFLADYRGFFATGLLIYQLQCGRRDRAVQCLLALAAMTAIYQADHSLAWLRAHSGEPFSVAIVSAICLLSIIVIRVCVGLKRFPVPGRITLAIGGMTYPLYLLHQQLGYTLLEHFGIAPHAPVAVAAVIAVVAMLSLAVWAWFERPAQRWTRNVLSREYGRWADRAAAARSSSGA